MWLAFGSDVRELRNGELAVGSGAEADWRIANADLRPRHFVLTIYDLNASLKPASRESVVVVNSAQVTTELHRLLNDGDVVLAGCARFRFSEREPLADDAIVSSEGGPAYLIDDAAHVAYALRNRSVGIGRHGSNAIVLTDPTASRFHAEVRREAGGFALYAPGAAGARVNGDFVDGARLLAPGDMIAIASAEWRFEPSAPAGVRIVDATPSTDFRRSPAVTGMQTRVVEPPGRTLRANAIVRRVVIAMLLLVVVAAVALSVALLIRR